MKMQACRNCGSVGESIKKIQGYFLIELMLWATFMIPGIIYSIWRYCGPKNICPKCGLASMIPGDTPRGQAIIKQWNENICTQIGEITWRTK